MEAITLKLQIYQILKERILSGEYPLGEKLNIDSLCREFSVSNSPVREALSLLMAEHLVMMRPNAGAHVINLTLEDYSQLTDAYNILLLGGYEVCCRRQKKALLIHQLGLQLMNFEQTVRSGSDKDRLRAILLLDRCFVTATENKRSIDLFDNDLDLLYLAYVFNHQNRPIDWQHNIRRSKTLVQAVQEDQSDLVKEILCERTNLHIASGTASAF